MTIPRRLATWLLLAAGCNVALGATVIVHGNFAYGPDVSLLQPCESKKGLWVSESGAAAHSLIERHDAMTKKWYQEIYVRLKGTTRARVPGDGVSEDYDAVFDVAEIVELRDKNAGACPGK